MELTLIGESRHSDTTKVLQILSDANVPFFYEEIKHIDSPLVDIAKLLSNSDKLPVLFHKGVSYSGAEAIRNYCREIL